MRNRLNLIFTLFICLAFTSCIVYPNVESEVVNNSSLDLVVYYSEEPEVKYKLESMSSLVIYRNSTSGGIYAINMPKSVGYEVDGFNCTFFDKPLLKFVVYNKFSTPIIFHHDDEVVNIEPCEYYTYSSYNKKYSFYYLITTEEDDTFLIKGNDNDLIVNVSQD